MNMNSDGQKKKVVADISEMILMRSVRKKDLGRSVRKKDLCSLPKFLVLLFFI